MVDDIVGHLVDLLVVVVLESFNLVQPTAFLDLLRHEIQELLNPLVSGVHWILSHVLGVLEHVAEAIEHNCDHLSILHREKLAQRWDHAYNLIDIKTK